MPCLFLVYTRVTPWTPPSLSELTRGYVSVPGPLFPSIYMDVLHDDFSDWGLPRELDLIVRAERARYPGDYLTSGFPEGIRALKTPHTALAQVQWAVGCDRPVAQQVLEGLSGAAPAHALMIGDKYLLHEIRMVDEVCQSRFHR